MRRVLTREQLAVSELSVGELAANLRAAGMEVDHFHVTDDVLVLHINEREPGRWFADRPVDNDEVTNTPVSVFDSLAADEWHEA